MVEPLRNLGPTAPEPPLMPPPEREAVLDDEIKKMTGQGFYLLTRLDHMAVLACEQSISLVTIFVDEYGDKGFS
jgi:hypothetical protein